MVIVLITSYFLAFKAMTKEEEKAVFERLAREY